MTHTVHRHEPAVAVCPAHQSTNTSTESNPSSLVKTVQETADLLVLDKPAALPIHTCGGYHKNCLIGLLEQEDGRQYQKFHTIHRLDRLTSGLVILAKSSDVAKHWSNRIRQRACQKYYLARVQGKFPLKLDGRVDRLQSAIPHDGEWSTVTSKEEEQEPANVARSRNAHGYWITDSAGVLRDDVSMAEFANTENRDLEQWLEHFDSTSQKGLSDSVQNSSRTEDVKDHQRLWLHLACPTRIAQPKIGVCEAGTFRDLSDEKYLKTVKASETSFGIISYDAKSDSTLLLCRPVTGRTHQIRLHCQYLGHCIANDPNYGGDMWYANEEGKEACAAARDILDANNGDDEGVASSKEAPIVKNISDEPATAEEIAQLSDISQKEDEPLKEYIKRTCVWCARCGDRSVVDHAMLEFLVRSRGIWLHALQYRIEDDESSNSLSFRTALPPWAEGFI
mgnify:CR=1 FL=1